MKKDAQIVIERGVEYVYQPILFKPEIMQEYYVGNDFVGMDCIKNSFDEERLFGLMQVAGMDGFMPELVRELSESVIGTDNLIYDGYDFGREEGNGIDEVNFYFMIKKSEYAKIMDKIKYWSIAKGFDHLIRMDVKRFQYANL